MPLPLLAAAIPAALQTGLGIYQAITGNKQAKKNDKLVQDALANTPVYEESPYASKLLADTQGRLNAASPAVIAAYRNANQRAANQGAIAQRNASSGAEAIAAGAAAQNQVNNLLPSLANAQQSFDAQNRGMYYDALGNMTNERDKVFNDRMRRNMDLRNYYLGRTAAGNRNLQSGLSAAATGLSGIGNMIGGMNFGNQLPIPTDYSAYGGLDANGVASPSPYYGTSPYYSGYYRR